MSKQVDTFQLNTYELPRRAGEMKEYELDIVVKESFGVDLIAVPAGDLIEVDVRLESVTEGILLSADVYAVAKGECIRCLDPVEIVIDRKIQELDRLFEPARLPPPAFGFVPCPAPTPPRAPMTGAPSPR